MQPGGRHYIVYHHAPDVLKIWLLADFHLLNRFAHTELLKEHIKEIEADPNAYWIGLGDYADCISPGDPRFDAAQVDPKVRLSDTAQFGKYASDLVAGYLEPIAHKGIGLVYGNHEWAYMNNNQQQDLHAALCVRLGMPNFGYASMFRLVFSLGNQKCGTPGLRRVPLPANERGTGRGRGRTRRGVGARYPSGRKRERSLSTSEDLALKFGVHHGAGGAATPAGRIRRLEKGLHTFDCDVLALAHLHNQHVLPLMQLSVDRAGKHIYDRPRLGVMTGSYLRAYGEGPQASYAERWMLPPSYLGAAVLEVCPKTRQVTVQTRVTFRAAE